MLGVVLYALLGMVLAHAGVGINEKPLEFFLILGLVVAIDLSTQMKYW